MEKLDVKDEIISAFAGVRLGDGIGLWEAQAIDDYSLSRLSTFTQSQKLAVVTYLEWCLGQEDYEFDHPAIKRALSEYWEK